MLKHLYKITKCPYLVLGVVFLNSVLNGKIENKTKFKKSFISFAPSDTGNSIGSALYVYHNIKNKSKINSYATPLIGPEYKNNQILETLKEEI